MLKVSITALLVLVGLTASAEARRYRHDTNPVVYSCGNPYMGDTANYCSPNFLQGVRSIKVNMKRDSRRYIRNQARYARHKTAKPAQMALRHHFPQQQFNLKSIKTDIIQTTTQFAARLQGIVEPLAAKAAEIQANCGSKVISGVRNTYIAGTRTISLHASGRAVDMAGNPSCIYAHLKDWSGGYSTDYSRVAHVHISWGGREHGARFAHGWGSRTRYAARHRHYAGRHAGHRRYASARYYRQQQFQRINRYANAG